MAISHVFYSLWPIIQGLIVSCKVFVICSFLVFIVLCMSLSYVAIIGTAFFQVEGDSSEDELHVPFLESGIAHPGEAIPSLPGAQYPVQPDKRTPF